MLPQCCRVPGQEGIRCICRVLPPAASACGTNANGVHVIKTWTMPDGPVHKTLKGKISVYLRWLVPFSRRPAAAVRSREEAIYRSACRIIEDNGIDTVVCVHLPSETLLAGCRIKERYPQVCVCAYQLDTLSGGNLPRFYRRDMHVSGGLRGSGRCSARWIVSF